ncbi:hypothetical protein [Marinicella sp. W31]|uniref:hypothetical protein n=1 Tax=Marinicella sp. W31 TaxID=3023713 RepID=UPI00375780E0
MLSRKIHRILTWVVGLQVALWMLSGLAMSLFDIETVRGSHVLKEKAEAVMDIKAVDRILTQIDSTQQIKSLKAVLIGDAVYYQFDTSDGSPQLYNASGMRQSLITEEMVRSEVNARYAGPGSIAEVVLLEQPITEIRGRDLPIWQVKMQDFEGVRLYVSATTGQIQTVRTRWWRIFDFFWMLHIMDYSDREDTSHPLLMLAASSGLMIAMTGLWLLVRTTLSRRRRKNQAHTAE